MKVWMDGKLVDEKDAKVSVFDHCVLYGDGVFEGIRAYNGTIFQCKAHVDRLFASAKTVRMGMEYTAEQLTEAMYATMKANKVVDGYIRLVVTRGPGTLGLDPHRCKRSTAFIIAGQIALYPPEMYEKGLKVIVAKTRRISTNMLPPSVKSCNYLNNILANLEASDVGAGEAIMLNADGQVAEATGDNIFLVRGGKVVTPPTSAGILIGVTRRVVLELCGELGIPAEERPIAVDDLRTADEIFLTGTAAEVIAVTSVDGRTVGSGKAGPITSKLLEAFRAFIRAECGG